MHEIKSQYKVPELYLQPSLKARTKTPSEDMRKNEPKISETRFFFPEEPIVTGIFLRRPNRFVIECLMGNRTVKAHLANPGRLWELLLPGREILLLPRPNGKATAFFALAVKREGTVVPLDTHLANGAAGLLFSEGLIPGWEEARVVKREPPVETGRLDFLLELGGRDFFLEVKSCSLFGRSLAMFPDAPTSRGTKHLRFLSGLSETGAGAGILFLVHSPRVEYFLPDYHTDPIFARSLFEARAKIAIRALGLNWGEDLGLAGPPRELAIPWEIIPREAGNSGSYLFLLKLEENKRIHVGRLGWVSFPAGHYIYVGSAKKNLKERMARHLGKRKNLHWHIDYLRNHGEKCKAIPVRTRDDLEHEIAASLGNIFPSPVPGFGSSDCSCLSHLFFPGENPLENAGFIKLLQRFRMDRLALNPDAQTAGGMVT